MKKIVTWGFDSDGNVGIGGILRHDSRRTGEEVKRMVQEECGDKIIA